MIYCNFDPLSLKITFLPKRKEGHYYLFTIQDEGGLAVDDTPENEANKRILNLIRDAVHSIGDPRMSMPEFCQIANKYDTCFNDTFGASAEYGLIPQIGISLLDALNATISDFDAGRLVFSEDDLDILMQAAIPNIKKVYFGLLAVSSFYGNRLIDRRVVASLLEKYDITSSWNEGVFRMSFHSNGLSCSARSLDCSKPVTDLKITALLLLGSGLCECASDLFDVLSQLKSVRSFGCIFDRSIEIKTDFLRIMF